MLETDGSHPARQLGKRFYPADLQLLLQSFLKTLADIDFAYEQDCERVRRAVADVSVRDSLLERLREQHQDRRRPYVQHLSALQQQMTQLVA